ncbi:MAG TPA: hypothetical protein VGI48_13805 [Caldimonas sp.]|jgi:hypothetical protein
MSKPRKIDDVPRRQWRITTDTPQGEPVDDRTEDRISPSTPVELVEASWVGSTWDLLTGLDVVETALGELFDEFFDSESGGARQHPSSIELSKDQWVLAFSIELAELDRHLDPTDVIRLAKTLWRKKGHLPPKAVARDAFSTGWMLRATRERERS